MYLSFTSKKYEGSKKATHSSALLHAYPINIIAWAYGIIGTFFFGMLFYADHKISFFLLFIVGVISLLYALFHKSFLEKRIIKSLASDCPDYLTKEELEMVNSADKKNIKKALKLFKERNNKYI